MNLSYVHLTADERETIARLKHDGISQACIAVVLKRAPPPVGLECATESVWFLSDLCNQLSLKWRSESFLFGFL
ncbi:helix-turn-helix domain-containing protein [Rubinisphaera sp. JC750]|uniref:helix-turn-helix domain-containing protein n=1 Tax=Rubinisphaera sp. JC750 TaxID=2898658 RepID=UPI0039657131